jgi:hypothetical protein
MTPVEGVIVQLVPVPYADVPFSRAKVVTADEFVRKKEIV